MSCVSWFMIVVAPYSFWVIVFGGWLGFIFLGVIPFGVMRPMYSWVIFCARCFWGFHLEVTL